MSSSAKVTAKGQITIPAEVRLALGVKEGDRLVFEQTAGQEFRVRPAEKRTKLKGILKPYLREGQVVSLEEMDEAIASRAAERLQKR